MKIGLSKTEAVVISERRTIIDEENRVYIENGNIIPFGSILIEAFNRELSNIDEMFEEYYQNKNIISIESEFDNSSRILPFDLVASCIENKKLSPGLKTAINNNNETLPFTVTIYNERPVLALKGSPDCLLMYDLLKAFELGITIKLCSNCGRAFIRSTQDRYCSICKHDETLKKELTRRSNARRNQNPALKLQNAIRHRKEYRGPASPYYLLISHRCPAETDESRVCEWVSVDHEYTSARRAYIQKYGGEEIAAKDWEKALDQKRHLIKTPEDLRTWLASMI